MERLQFPKYDYQDPKLLEIFLSDFNISPKRAFSFENDKIEYILIKNSYMTLRAIQNRKWAQQLFVLIKSRAHTGRKQLLDGLLEQGMANIKSALQIDTECADAYAFKAEQYDFFINPSFYKCDDLLKATEELEIALSYDQYNETANKIKKKIKKKIKSRSKEKYSLEQGEFLLPADSKLHKEQLCLPHLLGKRPDLQDQEQSKKPRNN